MRKILSKAFAAMISSANLGSHAMIRRFHLVIFQILVFIGKIQITSATSLIRHEFSGL
ncbi:MAG: hypothetical protein ACTSRA_12025 [Promethearchaeota archaeon]